ncbi:hypothetical protein GA0115245_11961, partial [Streptomyces sp. di188]
DGGAGRDNVRRRRTRTTGTGEAAGTGRAGRGRSWDNPAMDLDMPELPFPLRTYGPDGSWSHEDGVLTGWAGPRQDRFVPPTGESLESAADAPRLLGAPDGDFRHRWGRGAW